MEKFKTVLTMLVLSGLFVFSDSGFAAKGGTPGPPTGRGGGGGGSDLGDLIVLYRDAWGVPILTEKLCQQPLAAPGVIFKLGEDTDDDCVLATGTESCLIPVDSTTCAVVVGYETYTQEVDFGRTSVVRSPVSVIEQSLGEVVTKLATAQCTSLDPAGRLVNTSMKDGEVWSATIDSPLENLAIYRQLMLKGNLGADVDVLNMAARGLGEAADNTSDLGADATLIVLPDYNVLNTAARGLGAAVDKTGKVTVDQVVYINEIMGLTDEKVHDLPAEDLHKCQGGGAGNGRGSPEVLPGLWILWV